MKDKPNRSVALRAFNALCAITLLVSALYVAFAGLQVFAVTALVCATAAVAGPVAMSGEGFVEVLLGVFEAILDGLMAVVDAIASLFSG